MVFSAPEFLFLFLPLALLLYYLTPAREGHRARNIVLALLSLVFYWWGGGRLVFLLLFSIAANFGFGKLVDRSDTRRKIWLGVAIAFNLILLGYFKYANFFAAQVGVKTAVLLPIGISFYTFHAISYLVDIYRRVCRPKERFIDFLLYIALFPQLIAGPIVRYNLMEQQLPHRRERLEDAARGALRFSWGLAKKILIADQVGSFVDVAFHDAPGVWTAGSAWLAALGYTVQIYFDFSAYSDMAIGLGLLFGFRLPENFARPYSAVSVTDFWRRWHLTLSNWFRDYLYIPLGGNRGGPARTALNLLIVFLLTGLWHGAAWTFVLWGLYHGTLLTVERVTDLRRLDDKRWVALRRAVTLLLVIFGWVLFRAQDLGQAGAVWRAMLASHDWSLPVALRDALTNQSATMLALGLCVCLLPRTFVTGVWLEDLAGSALAHPLQARLLLTARIMLIAVLLPLTLVYALNQDFSPFLYYQF